MPDSAGDSKSPNDVSQTPTPHYTTHSTRSDGTGIADANALPPEVTPATTSRQSVALGGFSSLWENNITPTINALPVLSDNTVPAIISHAPPADAQGGTSDLAASTGSVLSTTTTLTNTLPPTQSAALRALNAPAFHLSPTNSKPAKSTSSRTTVTSQPVVVRTYSGSRHHSRPGSGFSTPRSLAMNGHTHASALSAGLAGKSAQLPSAEDFSFSAILRAVDPEIRDAIDAIAEICARSRMSLADEYEAHLPPQGEITDTGPGWVASAGALPGRGRLSRIGQGWTATTNTLMAVPEASSSSERLAQENKVGSSKKRSQSAYGSLKSVISGGSGKRKAVDVEVFREQQGNGPRLEEGPSHQGPSWAVRTASSQTTQPAITLVTSPRASKQLSFDTAATVSDAFDNDQTRPQTAISGRKSNHRRGASTLSFQSSRPRSSTLSSISSWLPWPRQSEMASSHQQDLTKAEARLRDMLASCDAFGKGKSPVTVI